ncbi:MAG: radical SAM protein [Candidatus Omnitrophica bacterium]|nr:radical SAM protein [Candidatus Omnitrophota bacterium]MBU4467510.1 radical SAM protein [Candidatus Omnitrophota bacterium]MCG2713313.1 radical SAM protein [Candidatus Omnitrophota bacterium]
MCNIWKKKKNYEVTLDEVNSIFSRLRPLDVVRITGGEPFLRNDLAEIVGIINKYAKSPIVHITTNGTLTEKILSFIRKVKNPRNIHIKISIDALREEHNRVRGVNDSYAKAMLTLAELSGLKQKYGFYLGVNQTIVSPECRDDYNGLQEICNKYHVKLYPVLAYAHPPLYAADNYSAENQEKCKTSVFGSFSHQQIIEMFNAFKKDISGWDNFAEKITASYYLEKLHEYLSCRKNHTQPKCVALRSHLRILPNGDVPVCLYNPAIVGNLLEELNFKKFWLKNKNIEKYRQDIRRCSGCLAKCELIPNGIYTGDIIKNIFS